MSGHKQIVEICSTCTDPVYVEVCNLPVTPPTATFIDSSRVTFAPGGVVSVPAGFIPLDSMAVTIYNDTSAAIAFSISAGSSGTHQIPPRAAHSITLPEMSAPFSGQWSVASVAGNAGPASNGVDPALYVNWVTRTP